MLANVPHAVNGKRVLDGHNSADKVQKTGAFPAHPSSSLKNPACKSLPIQHL